MHIGIIRSIGKCAITIQDKNKKQFYGPKSEIVDEDLKKNMYLFSTVEFNINLQKHSFRTPYGLRYYAENIRLQTTIEI